MALDALHAAANRAVGWWQLPEDLPYREILNPDRTFEQSMSMGTTSSGTLLNAEPFPFDGPHHSVVERHRSHGTRWGTEEMVKILQAGAEFVGERHGGAPLRIGNIARKGGGDIPWSHSHNSGRDADIAFYCVDAETGESVPAPDLLQFNDEGVAMRRPDLRFDVPRNWALVEGLLRYDSVNIQWIFVSNGLKKLMLDHAREIGADSEIIARAESVLLQPTDALPHDDHFHLRIGCARRDRIEGCIDQGPQWAWGDWHDKALLARSLELAKAFENEEETEIRLQALSFLESIRSPFAADVATMHGVWDPDPVVREQSMRIASSQYNWTANALVQIQKYVRSGALPSDHVWRAYSILRRSLDPIAQDFAIERIADAEVQPREKVYAARALSHFMNPDLIPFILEQLEHQTPDVRAELAAVLQRITNRSEGIDWETAGDSERARALASWRSWWEKNKERDRDIWLIEGFKRHGVEVADVMNVRAVDELLPLLVKAPAHVVYNANRVLRELTGRWAPLEQDDGRKLHKYWDKWWRKNRDYVMARK